jgi:AbrB family looped-hinge helix DNA binding protein
MEGSKVHGRDARATLPLTDTDSGRRMPDPVGIRGLQGKSNHGKNRIKMRITSKGQVTIPQDLRERFGLLPNTEVEFVPTDDGQGLRLLKSAKSSGRGRALVERLRGRGTSKHSTDELLKMMRSEA